MAINYSSITVNGVTGYTVTGISGLSSTVTSVTVPSTYNDLPVLAIADNAFATGGKEYLKELVLPNSIQQIGTSILAHCMKLEKLTVPFIGPTSTITSASALTLLGFFFADTTDTCTCTPQKIVQQRYLSSGNVVTATSRVFPANLSTVSVRGGAIHSGAFSGLTQITTINLDSGITSIDNGAFAATGITSLTVRGNPTIRQYAFSGVTSSSLGYGPPPSLTKITIAADSKAILSTGCFDGLLSTVTSLEILGASRICSKCLYQNSYVKTLILGQNIDTVETGAFTGNSLEEIHYKISKVTYTTSAVSMFSGNTSNFKLTLASSVRAIPDYLCINCKNLTSLEISNGVTTIGTYAFAACSGLTEVVLPKSITDVGDRAFSACSNLTGIRLLENVITVGDYAFYNCTSLTSAEIGDSVTTIGSAAFYNCSSLTSVAIGSSVETINSNTFYGCSSLTEIVIPDSVITIGTGAFRNCSSLTRVVIGNGVTSIGSSILRNCTALAELTLPFAGTTTNIHFGYIFGASSYTNNADYVPVSLRKVTITGKSGAAIHTNAFYDCSNITELAIYNAASISIGAVSGCTGLEKITLPYVGVAELADENTHIGYIFGAEDYSDHDTALPSTLKEVTILKGSLGKDAIRGCSSLTDITIGNGIMSIGEQAFMDCSSLKNVTISSSITSIGKNAFKYCGSLTRVYITDVAAWCNISFGNSSANPLCYTKNLYLNNKLVTELIIPDTVTEIKAYAFYNCDGLTGVVIPDGVTSIGDSAFCSCSSLTSVKLASSTWSIGRQAFVNCTSLASITIPAKITTISAETFRGCSNLTKALFAEDSTLKTIGENAFSDCVSLEGIEFPSTVTTIGKSAFSACEALETITFTDNITTIGEGAFGRTHLASVLFGENSKLKTIDSYAFAECNLTEASLPDSLETIGNGIFRKCDSLATLTIPFIGEKKDGTGVTHIGHFFDADKAYVPSSLETLIINGGNIAVKACENCPALTHVTLNGVNGIGVTAFSSCSGLTTLQIYNSNIDISHHAFAWCNNLTSVIIGSGVTNIGHQAFLDCNSLASVEIGKSVTTIGSSAFSGCNDLTSIILPDSVTTIEGGAFTESGLASLTFTKNLSSIGDAAFRGVALQEISFSGTLADWASIEFGDKDANPFNSALTSFSTKDYNSSSTSEITFTEDIEEIKSFAFSKAPFLSSIALNAQTIGNEAFSDCPNLTTISILDKVTELGEGAFSNCPALTSIALDHTPEDFGVTRAAFVNAELNKAQAVTLHVKTSNLAANLFENINIETIEVAIADFDSLDVKEDCFKNSLPNLTKLCFADYSDLEKWCRSTGLKHITTHLGTTDNETNTWSLYAKAKSQTFNMRSSISISYEEQRDLELVEGLDYIAPHAFANCDLDSISIPTTLTAIDYGAFEGCALEEVYVRDLEKWCNIDFNNQTANPLFCGNAALYEVVGVTTTEVTHLSVPGDTVKPYAFAGCSSITTISAPIKVKTLGNNAFESCGNLTSAAVGKGVSEVPVGLFYGCEYLESISFDYYDGSEKEPIVINTEEDNEPFAGCTQLKTITFRNSPPATYDTAEWGLAEATELTTKYYVPHAYLAEYRSKWPRALYRIEAIRDDLVFISLDNLRAYNEGIKVNYLNPINQALANHKVNADQIAADFSEALSAQQNAFEAAVTELETVIGIREDEETTSIIEQITYDNSVRPTQTIGGIEKGADLTGLSVAEILDMLLHPYVAPVINSFTFSFTADSATACKATKNYFSGDTVKISTATLTYTKGSHEIKSARLEYLGSWVNGIIEDGVIKFFFEKTLTATTTFKVYLYDAKSENVACSSSTTINFAPAIYYGAAALGNSEEVDLTELKNALIKEARSSKKVGSFTVDASSDSGEDVYIYYMQPVNYATPVFSVGGFAGGFESKVVDNMAIYVSAQPNLGETTVVIS